MEDTQTTVLWKQIPNTQHFISSEGLVKNSNGLILTTQINDSGYEVIAITLNGVSANFKIHRLVAKAFIPNPDSKATVNHIDTNKLNNRVNNLEWATHSENLIHAFDNGLKAKGEGRTQAVLTDKEVVEIKHLLAAKKTDTVIAGKFKVNSGTISKIRQLRTWTHVRPDIIFPYNSPRKLTADDIPNIRRLATEGLTHCEIGRRFNVTGGTINGIVSGRIWKNY